MSEKTKGEVVWAVLAPLDGERLRERVARAWDERYAEMEGARFTWEVLPGRGDYSAVVDRTPGSEGDDESLAEELSGELAGEVYLLRLRDEGEAAWAYRGGELARDLGREPRSFAEGLGCALDEQQPEPQSERPASSAVTVCVVEGATAEEVAASLGPFAGRCRVAATPAGALVTSDSLAVSFLSYDIAEANPAADVYSIISDPPARFAVMVVKGGGVFGNYEFPFIKTPYPPLPSIKGETEPERIAAALGVPPELLGLRP